MIEKFARAGKVIVREHYTARKLRTFDELRKDEERAEIQQEAQRLVASFQRDYVKALDSPDVRTIVWDTTSEIKQLYDMAAFGKLTQVLPRNRTEAKFELNKLPKMVFSTDKNLIMIARLGERWHNDKPTGEMEPKGMTDILYLADTYVRTYAETEDDDEGNPQTDFWFEVETSRTNTQLIGRDYSDERATLPHLAADMFGTDLDAWR